jgi:protease IV
MKTPRLFQRTILVGALALTASLTGCIPQSMTISLGGRGARLAETTIHHDPAAAGTPADKIALIDLRGLITETAVSTLTSSTPSPIDALTARLNKAARDNTVKAVILRINSPGGSVTASDIAYREIQRFKNETGKPVVASLGEVAASGGYYTALAADEIVTMPTTITASIGVIIPSVNLSRGLNMIGIVSNPIVSGPNKAMGSPLSPEQAGHVALLQGIVDEFYANFKGLVIERRPGLEAQYVQEATDGRVVTGRRAVAIGLADRTGDLYDAFDRAKQLAGIESARLVKYHTKGLRPRSPYASTNVPLPQAAGSAGNGTNSNNPPPPGVLKLDLGSTINDLNPSNAYYVWTR